jgi:hypothetical protein
MTLALMKRLLFEVNADCVVDFPPVRHPVEVGIHCGRACEWSDEIGNGRVDAQFGVIDQGALPEDDITGSDVGYFS